jgi:hypothetical protein
MNEATGTVKLTKQFIDKGLSEFYFNELSVAVPWGEVEWKKGKKLPRLCFRYDAEQFGSIEPLDQLINTINIRENVFIEGCWCNLYRTGEDYTPPHQDQYSADIYTLSFGSTRDCLTKPLDGGKSTKHTLESGDLFFFNEEFDSRHKHSIPVRKTNNDPRISVVFFTS